ncbi:MAG: SMC family ATPase, partial [Dehalococcoidia bacterium]
MIPVKLALRNFMSYRDPPDPLVLDGIHIACICGDNGNGKSALLDAMTWALWGKARAKSADDLVHSGQSDMEVELEFTNGEGRYRVIRKHTKGKPGRSGHTVLELQVTSLDEGSGFRAITANTVRETQKKIIDLLRMEYETFVNSAFLRQGRADEFTLRTPRERKQVLADILNLSVYDELETGARKRAREIEVEVAVLEKDLAAMEEELKKRPEVQGDLSRVKARLSEAERDEALQRVQVEKLARRKDLLEVNKADLERIRERTDQAQKDLHLLSEEMELHRRRIIEYEAVMEQQNAVTEGYGLFQEAVGQKEEMDRKLARSNALVEGRSRLEREIDAERVRLVGEVEGLRARVQTLESKASNIKVWEEELAECSKKLADLDELEMEVKQSADDLQETSATIQHLEASNQRLMREMQDLRDKVDMLEKGVAECPLCGSALGEDGLDHIRSAYEEEGLGKKQEYLENQKVIKEVSAGHGTARREMEKKQGELAWERRGTQGRVSLLERDREEGNRAKEELTPLRTRLDDMDSRLAAGSFKIDTQRQLKQVTSELEALGYDPQAHKQVLERLDQIKRYEELHRRLAEARDRLPEVQQALELAESRESRLRSQMEVDFARQESIEAG